MKEEGGPLCCVLSKLRPTLNILHHMTILISTRKTRVRAHNGNKAAHWSSDAWPEYSDDCGGFHQTNHMFP